MQDCIIKAFSFFFFLHRTENVEVSVCTNFAGWKNRKFAVVKLEDGRVDIERPSRVSLGHTVGWGGDGEIAFASFFGIYDGDAFTRR